MSAPPAGPAPGGPSDAPAGSLPNQSSNRKMQQTQAEVEQVVDVMRVNVEKVLERDQKLSELDNRADKLQEDASMFESSAAKLKRKFWWKNCKMMIIMGAICAIIVVIIISVASFIRKESVYKPKQVDRWTEKRALFGVYDNIGILGDFKVHPKDLIKGPQWLRGWKGNELQRCIRKKKMVGYRMFTEDLDKLNKRIRFLYRRFNRRGKFR